MYVVALKIHLQPAKCHTVLFAITEVGLKSQE